MRAVALKPSRELDRLRERFSQKRSRASSGDSAVIERGEWADYRDLAGFHYKADDPGVAIAIYRARVDAPSVAGRYLSRRAERRVVGVQVVSMPHAGCTMRDYATGGRYRGVDLTTGMIMLNRELRTLSRTIVHPQYRGLGLAVGLVRHALARVTTPCAESIAAMGRVHPFLEKAGMTRYDPPVRAEHARLLDALDCLGFEARDVRQPGELTRRIEQLPTSEQHWFARELRIWRRKACMKRNHVHPTLDLESHLVVARDHLLVRPVYYLWWRDDAQPPTREEPTRSS